MKTQKIIKKFKEIGLETKITVQDRDRISVDIIQRSLADPDMERLLKAFPSKKYNVTVKAVQNSLTIEIFKIPQRLKFRSCGPLMRRNEPGDCFPFPPIHLGRNDSPFRHHGF